MAATNPFRVSDLIAKYGWKIMPYLSNLGATVLAEAQILFVDSGNTANKLDADDGEHGHSFEKPLATIDYAIGLLTADEQGLIIAAPGHNDSLGDAQIDFDISGVHLIGVGEGSLKPRIDYDHANSSIDIGANNVTIQNIDILPSITSVLIGVHVETGVTDFHMKDVRFLIGEDGSGADEFIKAVELTSGNHDCIFENVTILAHASAAQATHGIHIAAASDRLVFRNVIIDGPYATGGIVEAAAGVNHIVEDCAVDVSGTNYSWHGSSTFAKRTNNVDGQVTEDESESLLLTTRGTGNYPTGITDNSILAYLLGKGATASASTFNNTTDSLEALADAIAAIDNTTNLNTAVPAVPTASALQDILQKDGNQTYDKSTDSLEAIADAILTGTNILAGVNLDHLMKTAVSDEQNMTEVANGSALAHILVKGAAGAITDFDPTTDSLEAIADAVAAITFTAAVSATPTARSLQDILEKDGTSSFDDTTDSLEAIADRLIDSKIDLLTSAADGTGNYPASVVQDSVIAMILSKSANPVASSYDNQTDSLEAIRDNQQTAARAAIDDAELDHLCELDGATQVYPENAVNDSIIAKILCKGDPATINTYDCQTDSLEAISDLIRTGTTALAGIQLDHLQATDTGVAVDDDLETFAVAGSLMAHIMSATKDATTYKCSTDSLEAISVALAAGTGCTTALGSAQLDTLLGTDTTIAADGDLEAHCVAGSVMAHILSKSKDATDYKCTTDSLQAISDKAGGFSGDGGAAQDDSVKASLDLAHTDLDTIIADTSVIDPLIAKSATKTVTNLSAASGATNIFTVSGGPVKVTSIVGIVANTIKNATINCKIQATPTTPGNPVDVTNVVDIDTAAAGSTLTPGATFGAALVLTANGVIGDMGFDFVTDDGNIIMNLSANGDADDSIEWYIRYEPLVSGATIAAA